MPCLGECSDDDLEYCRWRNIVVVGGERRRVAAISDQQRQPGETMRRPWRGETPGNEEIRWKYQQTLVNPSKNNMTFALF